MNQLQDREPFVHLDHEVNLFTAACRFKGTLEVERYTHFNGQLQGKLLAHRESTIVLGESSMVEGEIDGDIVIVDGFVRGQIHAKTKVMISETGRVIGNITSPCFSIQFGGHFEGQCHTASDLKGKETDPS